MSSAVGNHKVNFGFLSDKLRGNTTCPDSGTWPLGIGGGGSPILWVRSEMPIARGPPICMGAPCVGSKMQQNFLSKND